MAYASQVYGGVESGSLEGSRRLFILELEPATVSKRGASGAGGSRVQLLSDRRLPVCPRSHGRSGAGSRGVWSVCCEAAIFLVTGAKLTAD